MTLVGVRRVQVGSASPNQPSRWTLIDFEAPEVRAGALAEACAAALDQPGWYVDFHTAAEQYVVFSGRVFRYPRGDASSRAEAEVYALGRGVPPAQIDWSE
jgi:hypothetical protein